MAPSGRGPNRDSSCAAALNKFPLEGAGQAGLQRGEGSPAARPARTEGRVSPRPRVYFRSRRHSTRPRERAGGGAAGEGGRSRDDRRAAPTPHPARGPGSAAGPDEPTPSAILRPGQAGLSWAGLGRGGDSPLPRRR